MAADKFSGIIRNFKVHFNRTVKFPKWFIRVELLDEDHQPLRSFASELENPEATDAHLALEAHKLMLRALNWRVENVLEQQ